MVGHALGGAGALEMAAVVLGMGQYNSTYSELCRVIHNVIWITFRTILEKCRSMPRSLIHLPSAG